MLFPIVAIAVALAAPVGPDRHFDLTYTTADGQKLQLDLVVPPGPGPHPVVICLHGGAWKFGSRKDISRMIIPGPDTFIFGERNGSMLDILASRGFAAAAVSYRLAPKHKFPAQIEDAKTAVRFLRANAEKYKLDPERVAACGFSAGGHLACLLATTPDRPELAGKDYREQSDKVCCVVNFFGPTDLSLYNETPGIVQSHMIPLLGKDAAQKLEVFRKASPIEYVTKATAPLLTIHGTADVIVPMIHAERFHEKLVAAGAKSILIPVKGKGHGWSGETATETTTEMLKFLKEQMGKK